MSRCTSSIGWRDTLPAVTRLRWTQRNPRGYDQISTSEARAPQPRFMPQPVGERVRVLRFRRQERQRAHLPCPIDALPPGAVTPEIREALTRARGHIRWAAQLLGMTEVGLRRRLRLTVPHS